MDETEIVDIVDIVDLLSALSHPNRIIILNLLAIRPSPSLDELIERVRNVIFRLTSVSHHVHVLIQVGLIERTRILRRPSVVTHQLELNWETIEMLSKWFHELKIRNNNDDEEI